MHELSIACDLVEIAEAAARAARAERVAVVYLKLGVFAGVVKEALLFGYETAAKGTLLEGSRLEIEDVPLVVFCSACNRKSPLPSVQCFECPICGKFVTEIRQGKELELTSMEIIEHANETA
jgi:hydrogenase nickel incorporation protein HypA/HybF